MEGPLPKDTQTDELANRLHTIATIRAPRQYFRNIETDRIFKIESLDWKNVVRNMLPNALLMYDENNEVWEVVQVGDTLEFVRADTHIPFCKLQQKEKGFKVTEKGFMYDKVQFVRAAMIVQAAPWGRFGMMFMDLGRDFVPSYVDTPRNFQIKSMSHQSKMIAYLLNRYGVAYWGRNNSAGSVDPEAAGLMSVLYPHDVVSYDAAAQVPPEAIKRARSLSRWDDGLSKLVGEWITHDLGNHFLYDYWPSSKVHTDPMGVVLDLFNFGPAQFGDPTFIDFLGRLSRDVHEKLCYIHEGLFESKLDKDVIPYVAEAHRVGKIDLKEYRDRFFHFREGVLNARDEDLPLHTRLARNLYIKQHVGRLGGGWNIAMQFTLQKERYHALLAITPGFGKWGHGPVESCGFLLKRPPEPIDFEKMEKISAQYEQAVGQMNII